MTISPDDCSGIVREFDSQGWHRTGTAVDSASGEWLIAEMIKRGVPAAAEPFSFVRIDPERCSVSVNGVRIEGVPLFDSLSPAPNESVSGVLTDVAEPDTVRLLRIDQHRNAADLDEARNSSHRAIVAAVEGSRDGQTLLNAWAYDGPFGPPVVQVPISAWEPLAAAKDASETVTLRCGASRTSTEAFNIRADVSGSQPHLAPLVVLTPRSGWWHCAGERGGGIAIWLEMARAVSTLELRRSVVFLATTGHELGFLGAKRYLEAHLDLATDAVAWIHLGANIGAADTQLMVRSSDDELLALGRSVDGRSSSIGPAPEYQTTDMPAGEAAVVAAHGGRYISLIGRGFPLFHSTEDRWPQAVESDAIAAYAAMVLEIIKNFDSER